MSYSDIVARIDERLLEVDVELGLLGDARAALLYRADPSRNGLEPRSSCATGPDAEL